MIRERVSLWLYVWMFIKQMFNMMEVLTKIKLRIEVRGYLQNKVLIGYTWSPIASKETLNYFMVDSSKHKEILHQLYLIEKYYRKTLRIEYLWSWSVDMQTVFQNIQVNLKELWCYWNLCIELITLWSYLLMS